MFDTFFGLPLHPLIVHATEVIVPAAAIVVALAALWPRFRTWARFLPLAISVVALILIPLSTESGEALEERVGENSLIETHSELAEGLLPWVAMLVVVAAVMLWWYWDERTATSRRAPTWAAVVLAVAALVASTGTVVQAVRVGHSGATAVWSEDMGSTPAGESEDSDED